MAKQKRKFYQTTQTPLDGPEDQSSGRRYIPSKEKIRAWAMADYSGGRCQCYFCKTNFTVNYCHICYISWLYIDWVCRDCRSARNLQKV